MDDDRSFDHIPLQSSVNRHDHDHDHVHDDNEGRVFGHDDYEDYNDDTLPPPKMIGRRCARRVERACCTCATYFPLAFVYSVTTWAAWVLVRLGADTRTSTASAERSWVGPWCSVVAVVLDGLLVWSYSAAVFTPPGSTTNDQGYSTVPEGLAVGPSVARPGALTVKANGDMRFCKKCQARKPDRAHHCSTCRRCVLKMDHHCPWLATCIGLRNGKAFVLFLIYTTVFALFGFAVSGSWVWAELSTDATYAAYGDSFMPVQYIMLCVIGGIIGLVVGLFTSWHILLACRGQTTIECLETTRYQSPLRAQAVHLVGEGNLMTAPSQRLPDEEQGLTSDYDSEYPDEQGYDHAHENDDRGSRPGHHLSYSDLERYRAQQRHQAYLDEQDSKKMPHAFDLGVRRNLYHMFGPSPWLWALPICNTPDNGWSWDVSPKWIAARDRNQRERDAQRERERAAGWGDVDATDDTPLAMLGAPSTPTIITTHPTPPRPKAHPQPPSRNRPATGPARYNNTTNPSGKKRTNLPGMVVSPSKADRILGRSAPGAFNYNGVNLQKLDTSGRAVRSGLGDQNKYLEEEDDEEDDELDNTSEEETTRSTARRSLPTAAAAAAAAPVILPQPPSSSSGQQRSLSPLRGRWMPDPASGLLRKGGASSPTMLGSATDSATTSPTFAFATAAAAAAAATTASAATNAAERYGNNSMDDDGGVD